MDGEEPEEDRPGGEVGGRDHGAQPQMARLQEVLQAQAAQIRGLLEQYRGPMQDWVAGQAERVSDLMGQLQGQAGRMQEQFQGQLDALDRVRRTLEERVGRQLEALRRQQRELVQQFQAGMQEAPSAPPSVSEERSRPAAKKPTAKKSTAKKTTAKKSTAKKPTAKKTTAKKTTAKKPTTE